MLVAGVVLVVAVVDHLYLHSKTFLFSPPVTSYSGKGYKNGAFAASWSLIKGIRGTRTSGAGTGRPSSTALSKSSHQAP